MVNNKSSQPLVNELPSHFADRLGIYYSTLVNQEHKKVNGQFFTPIEIAILMGSFVKTSDTILRILDPGCGTSILTCALIEHLTTNEKLQSIDLVVYETDNDLIPLSKKSLEYLKEWLSTKKINLNYSIITKDFILENASCLSVNEDLFTEKLDTFDIIISNPPYFKLPIEDKRSIVAKNVVNGHPNIYAIFMAVSAKLLKENGQLIFITPRSYASGSYFKLFREYFFKIIEIDNVHLFISRKDTFNRDKVLQETIIIKGTRKEKNNPNHNVVVSSSQGLKDILVPETKIFEQKVLINLSTNEKILHLPSNDKEEALLNLVSVWENKLIDYDIQISTGPVVSFRSLKYIQNNYENGTVFLAPLFWLHNVQKMYLEWPKTLNDKGQYIRIEPSSKSVLIPNKNYVLLRRFSTKDDKSRLIAAPYFCNYPKSNFIGVENKVNYIYRKNGHLERSEVAGLCALLNSELFDTYFQIFNGNVNVSATELREMNFPNLAEVKEIGNKIILSNDYSMNNVNYIINEYFEINELLNNI
jgi:adenine-specific DNA-methyltransferase